MLNRFIGIVLFFTCVFTMSAQSLSPTVTASGGGSESHGGVSLDWTLGESSITTLSNGNMTLTQGFHQPKLVEIVGVDDYDSSIKVSLYPNPVIESLIITSEEENLSFEIYDLNGQLVRQNEKLIGKANIDISSFVPTMYFIHIRKESKPVKIYKIEKVH